MNFCSCLCVTWFRSYGLRACINICKNKICVKNILGVVTSFDWTDWLVSNLTLKKYFLWTKQKPTIDLLSASSQCEDCTLTEKAGVAPACSPDYWGNYGIVINTRAWLRSEAARDHLGTLSRNSGIIIDHFPNITFHLFLNTPINAVL